MLAAEKHHHPTHDCDGNGQCSPECRHRKAAAEFRANPLLARQRVAQARQGQEVAPPQPAPHMPAAKCKHLGGERRDAEGVAEVVECEPCESKGGGVFKFKTRNCSVFGRCVPDLQVAGVASCRGCTAFEPDLRRRYIAHGTGSAGLGDALLGLCAVHGYAAEHPDEAVVYGAARHTVGFTKLFEAPPGFDWGWGTPSDPAKGDLAFGATDFGFRHRGELDPCWTRLSAYCEMIGNPFPVLPKLKDRERVKDLASDYVGSVVLAPCVALAKYGNREWKRHSWLQLARKLRKLGHRVLVADNVASRIELFKAEFELVMGPAEGWPPDRLASLMLNAACLVGNDSGLAHLGGILGCPTVVLGGPTLGRQIFGFYPRVECLQGSLACDGCWWQGDYRGNLCDSGCASMGGIPVERVLQAVEQSAKRREAQVRVASHHSTAYNALNDLTWPSKRAYCGRHGFDWHDGCERQDRTWRFWQRQLELVPDGGWLWCLDVDAAITGDQDVRDHCQGDFAVAKDWNGPNCGSMLMRNCPQVHAMLADVVARRNQSRWMEQGLILDAAPKHSVDLRLVDQRAINSYGFGTEEPWAWRPGDLVCHMPGQSMGSRINRLTQCSTGI